MRNITSTKNIRSGSSMRNGAMKYIIIIVVVVVGLGPAGSLYGGFCVTCVVEPSRENEVNRSSSKERQQKAKIL